MSYNYTFLVPIKFVFAACKKEVPEKQLIVNVTKDVGGPVTLSTRTYAMESTLKILAKPSHVYIIK